MRLPLQCISSAPKVYQGTGVNEMSRGNRGLAYLPNGVASHGGAEEMHCKGAKMYKPGSVSARRSGMAVGKRGGAWGQEVWFGDKE